MLINFREGIVDYDTTVAPFILTGNTVNLVIGSRPLIVTIADQTTDYLFIESTSINSAWTLPSSSGTYWLYWDFNTTTFARTFGVTTLAPIIQNTVPASPVSGQYFYNTATNEQFVYSGSMWIGVLRVFACEYVGINQFISLGLNSPLFSGTQVGNTTSNIEAGLVLFDYNNVPILKSDGTFFTTEDEVFAQGSAITGVRLESNVWTAQSSVSIGAYGIVAVNSDGTIRLATYNDTGSTVIGIALQSFAGSNSTGAVLLAGTVSNPAWNWAGSIGQPLWVSYNSTLFNRTVGTLQLVDPNAEDPITNSTSHVPVARVLTATTVIFEQGLGQKGDPGSGTGGASGISLTVSGGTGLNVAGSPIIGSGTIALTLSTELQGLSTLSSSGLVSRIGIGSYTGVTLTPGSARISIINGNGISGNPTIDVNQASLVLSLTQVTTALGFTPYDSLNPAGYISNNQVITLTGDVTGTGTMSIPVTLANTTVVAGTYTNANITVDSKGRVMGASSGAAGAVTSVAATGSTGLVVGGSPITSNGTLTFTLGINLQSLSSLSSTGLVTHVSPGVFTERVLASGASSTIVITNPDGFSASPTFDLATVAQGNSGTFQKFAVDSYGRVIDSTSVTTPDITALANTQYVRQDGTSVMTGALNLGNNLINNVASPIATTDAANKSYVDAISSGLVYKTAVAAGSLTNVNIASAPSTLDGYSPVSGDRLLLIGQTTSSEEGIYIFSSAGSALTRSSDAASFSQLDNASVFILHGTTLGGQGYVQTTVLTSFSGQTWTLFAAFTAVTYTSGIGLSLSTGTFNVNLGGGIGIDGSNNLDISLYNTTSGGLILTTTGTTRSTTSSAKLSLLLASGGGLTQDTTGLYIGSAGVTNAMLSNNSFTAAGDTGTSSIALGGTLTISGTSNFITTSMVSGTLAINISASYIGQTSITTLGTIGTGTWHGSTIGTQYGGTGVNGSAAANGTLLIGNGTGYTLAALTGTANQVIVTNGSGSITLTLPQSIATTSTPTFAEITITGTPTNPTDAATKAYVDSHSSGGGGSGIYVCQIAAAFTFSSSSVAFATVLPANAIVDNVKLIVDTPFNGTAPTASVGISGNISKYMATADNNLTIGTIYQTTPGLLNDASIENLLVTVVSGSSTVGAGRVIVTYSVPTSSINDVQQIVVSLIAGSSSPVAFATVLPANAIVDNVKLIVDTPFNGTAPTASVGISGNISKYMATADNNLTIGGVYQTTPGLLSNSSSETDIITYTSGSSTVGAARIIITFCIPS